MKIRIALIIVFAGLAHGLQGENYPGSDPFQKSDTAQVAKKRSKFTNLLFNTISNGRPDKEAEREAARRDQHYFGRFEGRTIGNISIVRKNVFNDSTKLWAERKVNGLHRVTWEKQIRKDLLFRPGDKLDPALVINNRQLIRSRDYIADVAITVVPSGSDTSVVDLIVTTRDKWTISVDAEIESDGDTYIKLYDDNILGLGNKLGVSTYFNYKNGSYGGNIVEYSTPNIFGTFFSGRLIAGRGFDHADYGGELKKEFIKPTDYAAGASGFYKKEPVYLQHEDSTYQTAYRQWDFWNGWSFYMPRIGSSLFFTGRYTQTSYFERPDVDGKLNPYFHGEQLALLSVGLYRERFRASNLIYGYGVTEDIAYGYRFTLNGGYSWGEFGDRWYLGGDLSAGYFTRIGYIRWSFGMGSYLNQSDGRFYRTAMVTNVNYFSNLLGAGRYKVRQFIDLSVTRGWNRLDGYRETIGFTDQTRLRGLRDKFYGLNRAVLSSESVVFTPWNLANFRFALYGFFDMGLIGDDGNLFRNPFYSTVGAGVRIKNENLIFGTINIRLGVAIGRAGMMNAEYFNISSEQRRRPLRYIPQQASTVDYR